jgi:cellulose synthase/poly-beta-1,6-N-acetylglucosamine synthase-like glycosyltransferase
MTPLVSIVIPAYDAEPWISDTIESALNQTWPRKKIIIVNDRSSDETAAIGPRLAFKTAISVKKVMDVGMAQLDALVVSAR